MRAALKSLKNTKSEEMLSPSSAYLRLLLSSSPVTSAPTPIKDVNWSDPFESILLLEWRAALLVKEVSEGGGVEVDASCNQRVSRAVADAFVGRQVGELIQELEFEHKEKKAVRSLYHLVRSFIHSPLLDPDEFWYQYLLTTVEAGLVDLLSYKQFSASGNTSMDVARGLRKAIVDVCNELLPNAISLSDAFGFTDWEIDRYVIMTIPMNNSNQEI